jgi:hypothetical protein
MMRVARIRLFLIVVAGILGGGCGGDVPQNPTAADTTYGAAVDAIDAVPAPAVAAEPERYAGRRVPVDGRIVDVTPDGCALRLDTETGPPLRVEALRTGADTCAWRVPTDTEGFAVATGPLRTKRDTLRLSANGVQVTPVQGTKPDS